MTETTQERTPKPGDVYHQDGCSPIFIIDECAPGVWDSVMMASDVWHFVKLHSLTGIFLGNALKAVNLCASLGPDPAKRFEELLEKEQRCAFLDEAVIAGHNATDEYKGLLSAAERRYTRLVGALEELVCNYERQDGATYEYVHDVAQTIRAILAAPEHVAQELKTCKDCGGHGETNPGDVGNYVCSTCGGNGQILVDAPAHVADTDEKVEGADHE